MSFRPSIHGFPFPNWWPPGSPVIEVPTPFGTIPLGDAHGGVCGGMIFAAADYYHAQLPRPSEPDQPIFRYFCTRLLDSWNLPFGVLKYYDWQRRPVASSYWAGVRMIAGTRRLTITEEWPKIQAILDTGGVAPLGVVQARGLDPRRMVRHHQVLAYGYQLNGDDLVIAIYDPNYPNDDLMELRLSLSNPDSEEQIVHSCEGPTIRGLFLTEYEPLAPTITT